MEVNIISTHEKIPHGDVKVFNKHGKLIRIDSVEEYCMKKKIEKDGTMFRCTTCGHTLNIEMACERCMGKMNARRGKNTL